ncbi:arginase [Clostridium fermenticellae]|uniref:Arginase n=1 Tax=Clostridium fermenticellae TaxID=2068654 RepID=A0A386H462_9CLOT|nr:arginase [Clostridium fermenticellae]AYD40275.1 arginase [Clostridium fermenticellae]
MDISLIGVPIFFGCDTQGVQFGPKKIRENNILNILAKNHNVYDIGDVYVDSIPESEKYKSNYNLKYLKPITDINRNLAHMVYSSLTAKSFPLVIGGDHSLGLGSISGASKYFNNLAVVWVDAHGDINTDKTSPTGNIHGMPLASAMGLGFDALTNLYYKGKKVDPRNVFIIGARDLDEGEKIIIKEHHINVYSTEDVNNIGIGKIINEVIKKIQSNNSDSIHLSFDIDCLDPSLVPGTGTPVENGLFLDDAKYILKNLMQTNLVHSMDFVEFNPKLDKNNKTLDVCMNLLDWTFRYLD